MYKLAVILMALVLSACAGQTPTSTVGKPTAPNLSPLTLKWSLPEPQAFGYVALIGDLLLGRKQLTAIDLRTRKLAFKLPLHLDTSRTHFAPLGANYVALTGQNSDHLTIFDRSGQVLNTVDVAGGTHQSLHQLGPVTVGSSLYVVSGATLYKYRTTDLLDSNAQPVWTRTYPGFGLASLVVQDEDHVFVSTNADTSRRLIALDAQGTQRWAVDVASASLQGGSAFILGLYKDTIIAQAGVAGLQAYKLETGEKAWQDFPDINVCPSGQANIAFRMTIADDKVFLGPWGGTCVLAYQAQTGKLAWVFDAPNHITFDTTPLYLNGVVYATNSRLWALDAETGQALAVGREDLSDNIGSPLAYDPVDNQVVSWGPTGVFAYQPLK